MGYILKPMHEDTGMMHMGAFLWPYFLDQCGAYFSCISNGPRWYMLDDGRMDVHNHVGEEEKFSHERYPAILCNCGFQITAEESLVLARIARNHVAIQRTLPDQVDKDDFLKPAALQTWPKKVREDWTERLDAFAHWAEKSGGFAVY